jgi:hypothetical protein
MYIVITTRRTMILHIARQYGQARATQWATDHKGFLYGQVKAFKRKKDAQHYADTLTHDVAFQCGRLGVGLYTGDVSVKAA